MSDNFRHQLSINYQNYEFIYCSKVGSDGVYTALFSTAETYSCVKWQVEACMVRIKVDQGDFTHMRCFSDT